MNCQFCTKLMVPDGKWWECKSCGVCFISDELESSHFKWERDIGDTCWALNIYEDRTVLWGCQLSLGINPDDDMRIFQIEIPYAVQGVTQHNVIDKIKTLITFS